MGEVGEGRKLGNGLVVGFRCVVMGVGEMSEGWKCGQVFRWRGYDILRGLEKEKEEGM